MPISTRLAKSRRDFLVQSAGGVIAIAAPLVITQRKASAQASQISPAVLSAVTGSALALYQSGFYDSGCFDDFAGSIWYFHTNVASVGLDSLFPSVVPGAVAGGIAQFDLSLQNTGYTSAQALGWTGLPNDFFQQEAAAQPRIDQVQAVNTTPNFHTVLYNAHAWALLACRIQSGSRAHVTEGQAGIAAAAGGVLVAGGVGLMAASGTTAATLTAATTRAAAFTAFTLGAGLFVIGIGIAGYYAYQYIQGVQNTQPVGGGIPGQAVQCLDSGCASQL